MVYHLRCVHKMGKPVQCQLCGRQDFSSYRTFNRHQKSCKIAAVAKGEDNPSNEYFMNTRVWNPGLTSLGGSNFDDNSVGAGERNKQNNAVDSKPFSLNPEASDLGSNKMNILSKNFNVCDSSFDTGNESFDSKDQDVVIKEEKCDTLDNLIILKNDD